MAEFTGARYSSGFFNTTESLQHAGNVTRSCYTAVASSSTDLRSYLGQFGSFETYYAKVQEEILQKFTSISLAYAAFKDAIASQDYPVAAYHTGYALKALLTVDPPAANARLRASHEAPSSGRSALH